MSWVEPTSTQWWTQTEICMLPLPLPFSLATFNQQWSYADAMEYLAHTASLLFTLSSSPFTHHLPHMVISFSPFLLILTLPGFKGQEERLGKWAGSKYLADTGQGFSKLTQFFCRNLPESLRDPGRALCAYSSVMWKSPHLWLLRLLSSFISPLAFIA